MNKQRRKTLEDIRNKLYRIYKEDLEQFEKNGQ